MSNYDNWLEEPYQKEDELYRYYKDDVLLRVDIIDFNETAYNMDEEDFQVRNVVQLIELYEENRDIVEYIFKEMGVETYEEYSETMRETF